jgi:hypothetical protein
MQRDGEGSARDPLLHGAAGTEVLGIGPGALGFRVADGSPPTVLSSHASLCKASSADATACSWCTYRLIPPAVFDGSRRARQRLRSQRFNRNVYSI